MHGFGLAFLSGGGGWGGEGRGTAFVSDLLRKETYASIVNSIRLQLLASVNIHAV